MHLLHPLMYNFYLYHSTYWIKRLNGVTYLIVASDPSNPKKCTVPKYDNIIIIILWLLIYRIYIHHKDKRKNKFRKKNKEKGTEKNTKMKIMLRKQKKYDC